MGDTRIILGTATPGGGFTLYGAALVEAVREVDPSLEIEPRNTKGSTENAPLLEAGALDIALVQGEIAGEPLSGTCFIVLETSKIARWWRRAGAI